MPVFGHKAATTNAAENLFMRRTDRYLYIAGINYSSSMRQIRGTIPLDYLGIEASQIESIEEVWTGEPQMLEEGAFSYSIPPCDARIYKIKFVTEGNGTVLPETSGQRIVLSVNKKNISIRAKQKLVNVEVFSPQGQLLAAKSAGSQQMNVPLPSTITGLCLVKCRLESREVVIKKCIL
jgi:hypothetical protein